jgi:hypothetical protein
MGHLEESPIPDDMIQDFVETVRDTGATRGILCHAGPAWSKCPKELTFWDRATLAKTIGESLVAEALGLDAPGLNVHLHAPTDLTDVLPNAFLESETDVVLASAAAVKTTTKEAILAAHESPPSATPEPEDSLTVEMPMDLFSDAGLAALAAQEPEPTSIPAESQVAAAPPVPGPTTPNLFSYGTPIAATPAASPTAASAPAPTLLATPPPAATPAALEPAKPLTLDLPMDAGKGLELDIDLLTVFPDIHATTPLAATVTAPPPAMIPAALTVAPAMPTFAPPVAPDAGFAPPGAPALPSFAPPMSGAPTYVPGLPSPQDFAASFAPSIIAPATRGMMSLPSPAAPPRTSAPPTPMPSTPNIGISSLVAAAQALARPAAAAPTMVPVIASVSAATSMPQTTHRMLPLRLDIQAASSKVAQKLFGIDRAELILQPVHLFDYEVDSFKDGSLETDTLDGRIEVNGSDKSIHIVDPDVCNPDARGVAMPNVTPTERVMRVNSERARQLALTHIGKHHAKAVDVRIPDHHSGLYYAERRKIEPRPEQMRIAPLGVFFRPVWRLHGSNGQIDVDAVDGREVFAEVRGNRTDAIIID